MKFWVQNGLVVIKKHAIHHAFKAESMTATSASGASGDVRSTDYRVYVYLTGGQTLMTDGLTAQQSEDLHRFLCGVLLVGGGEND